MEQASLRLTDMNAWGLLTKILLSGLLICPPLLFGLLLFDAGNGYLGFALVGIQICLSWILMWHYANRKAREELTGWHELLYLPLWMMTSTVGILLWIWVRPRLRLGSKPPQP